MPNLSTQTPEELCNTYRDVYNKTITACSKETDTEKIKSFFGDDAYVEKLGAQIQELLGKEGKDKYYALVVLAKQKALDQLGKEYTVEDLVDISDPEKNPKEVREAARKILADLIEDPVPGEGEDPHQFVGLSRSEKLKRFNEKFLMPESNKAIEKLGSYFAQLAELSDEEREARFRSYGLQAFVDRLLNGYNEFTLEERTENAHEEVTEEEDIERERFSKEATDTDAKLTAMSSYLLTFVDYDAEIHTIYEQVREGNFHGYTNVPGYESQRQHFQSKIGPHLTNISNATSIEKTRRISDQFTTNIEIRKDACDNINFAGATLLSKLSDNERAVFMMDPQIRKQLRFSFDPVDENRMAVNISYRGINLQVYRAEDRVDTRDLEDLQNAIADTYNLHIMNQKLEACNDFGSASLRNLADAMTLVEANLNRNSKTFRSSGEYRDMQSALKNFRKCADRFSRLGRDLTVEEQATLTSYLTDAYGAANIYLDKKDAQNERIDFKNFYELGRVEAARNLAAMFEKTNNILSRARAAAEGRQEAPNQAENRNEVQNQAENQGADLPGAAEQNNIQAVPEIPNQKAAELDTEIHENQQHGDMAYVNFLQKVKDARDRMSMNLANDKQYPECARDMKLMVLYEESRQPDNRYDKAYMSQVMANIGNNDDSFETFLKNVDLGDPFRTLVARTSPHLDENNQRVSNKENAMNAMRAFVTGDGAEKIYQKCKAAKVQAGINANSPVQKKTDEKVMVNNPAAHN